MAPTGSGKTLGYLLPAVAACLEARQGDASGQVPAPAALVVLPTRELAQQVHRVCRPFQRLFGLRAACVTGGIDKAAQLAQLRDGPLALLAGTPGRLHELIGAEDRPETAVLSLGRVRLLVLDEGDKLLSMGADEELQRIRAACRSGGRELRVFLFSATLPPALEVVAGRWLREPLALTLSAATADGRAQPPPATSTDDGDGEAEGSGDAVEGPKGGEEAQSAGEGTAGLSASIEQVVHVCGESPGPKHPRLLN